MLMKHANVFFFFFFLLTYRPLVWVRLCIISLGYFEIKINISGLASLIIAYNRKNNSQIIIIIIIIKLLLLLLGLLYLHCCCFLLHLILIN